MAKTEWKRVMPLLDHSIFSEVDLKILEAYCQAYAKWKRCESILQKKGYTFKTPNGYEQQRPEISISKDAFTSMQIIAKELGFTPASRIRIDKNKSDNQGGGEGGAGGAGKGYVHDEEMENMISK